MTNRVERPALPQRFILDQPAEKARTRGLPTRPPIEEFLLEDLPGLRHPPWFSRNFGAGGFDMPNP
jgi:hypothetical protein